MPIGRDSFERLLFRPPHGRRGWLAGPVMYPELVLVAATVILIIVPLFCFMVMAWPWDPAIDFPTAPAVLLPGALSAQAIYGMLLLVILGYQLEELRRELSGSDLLLRLISDDSYPDLNEIASGSLAQLDYMHLDMATPFGRTRAAAMQLPFLLALRRRPGVPTTLSTLAMAPLTLLTAFSLLGVVRPLYYSAGLLVLATLCVLMWQWGFAKLLEITLSTGVLWQHVRQRDREEKHSD